MSYIIDILSITGPCLSVGHIVPQIRKTYKEKNVSGISIESLYMSLGLYSVWCLYGFFLGLVPLIITHALCFALTCYRVHLYYKYCPAYKD